MPKMQTFFLRHKERFTTAAPVSCSKVIPPFTLFCALSVSVHLLPVEGRQRRAGVGEARAVPQEQGLQRAGADVPAPPGQEEDQQGALHERGEELSADKSQTKKSKKLISHQKRIS